MSFLSTPKSMMPHRATALTVAMLASLSMSACAFKTDGPPPDPQIAKLQQELDANRPFVKSDFTHEYTGVVGEPNQYHTRTTWPKGRSLLVRITYSAPTDTKQRVVTFDARSENVFDFKCHERKLSFEIDILNSAGTVLNSFPIASDCPVDQVVYSNATSSQIKVNSEGRLFLMNSAVITVESPGLVIQAKELIMMNPATIRTGTRLRKTPWDPNSIQMPDIQIHASKASGSLTFELNGIDGSPVADKLEIVDRTLDGASGKDAVIETMELPVVTGATGFRERTANSKLVCRSAPTAGSNGRHSPIPKGEKGNSARHGIGTSNVVLNIRESSNLKLRFELNPGRKGNRGRGSIYRGGAPGSNGANPGGVCKTNFATLVKGNDSEMGEIGDDAAHGTCGSIFIFKTINQNEIFVTDINPEANEVEAEKMQNQDSYKTAIHCSRKADLIRTIK